MVLRLLFGKPGGKPLPPGSSSAAAPRATEARHASQSKSAAPSKLLRCEVAPPRQTTAAVPHRLLQFFLAQCAEQDFDSTKAMIALAKWAEYHDRTSTISYADLDRSELQQIHINLLAHRELIEAIDELMLSEQAGDADEFLKFLEEMRCILARTSSEIREICIEKKIDLNAPHRIDRDRKKTLSAALRLVCRRLETDNEGSFAARLQSALSNTPAQLAKHDLIWVMNDFRREGKGTVNTSLLEECLLQSFGKVRYGSHWEARAQYTVMRLMDADESERGQLLDDVVAAMYDLIDGGDPEKAREGFLKAVHHIWNGKPNPLLEELSRDAVDFLAVMRELLQLSLSGKKIDESMLWVMNRPKLSQAYRNILPYREIQELIDDLIGALDLWRRRPDPRTQPSDSQEQSAETRGQMEREREFMTHLSAINEQLQLTWTLLKGRCKEEGIGIAFEAGPFDPSEKSLIENTLKAAFSRIDLDRHRPVGECIERAFSDAIERERHRRRLSPDLAPVLDHFNSTGIIQPEFEDLVYDALGRAGIEDRSARRKLAQDARLGVMKLTAEYGRALLHNFSRILSDANFGPASKDTLVAIIRGIDIAEMPDARVPESTFGSVRSVEKAADWIHNLGLKVLVPHKYPDEKLADAVQSYLREQAVTHEMARDFLRYANRATLEGRSALVRQAIRDFLPKDEWPEKS